MPIIWRKNGNSHELIPEKIKGKDLKEKEQHLQELLAQNPALLQSPGEPALTFVAREIKLNCGDIDILLINHEGRITLVEVKLEKNPEIDRHIIGQIVDYASSLEMLTFEELNSRTKGLLDSALKAISTTDIEYQQKKNYCDQTLQRGYFQLILAVDSAQNSLVRKWLYESAHTDLDLRLAAIQKFRINDSEELFTSNILVSREAHRVRDPKAIHPSLIQVFEYYEKTNPANDQILEKRGPTNYAIYIKKWPEAIHYEFNYWEKYDKISIEVMVEKKKFPEIPDYIHSLKDDLAKNICSDFRWCQNRNGWARLAFLFNANLHPCTIAEKMSILIAETQPEINRKLLY